MNVPAVLFSCTFLPQLLAETSYKLQWFSCATRCVRHFWSMFRSDHNKNILINETGYQVDCVFMERLIDGVFTSGAEIL